MSTKQPLEPAILVIFGVTGDLAQRYLLPALYHLIKDGLLHDKTRIIGTSRRDLTAEQLFDEVELCVQEKDGICDPDALHAMIARTSTLRLDTDKPADYAALLEHLNSLEVEEGLCMNRLYYLSVPPQAHAGIIARMGDAGLNGSCPEGTAATRLLVEKPFGFDTASARELIEATSQVFSEEQLFRIDHYLAKETVQNILTFRFRNPIFEPLWNNRHIGSIEISASEKIGIEGRAHFYEPLGALRDFIQSHLVQLLAIVAMDKPLAMTSESIHAAKQELLAAVPSAHPAEARRGQYDGYRAEVSNPDSATETFAAVHLDINSERWQGVPVLLWTGKGLAERKTEITVAFRAADGQAANRLRFRIQPNEGIEVDLLVKKPGFETELQTAVMDFSYRQNFDDHDHPNAYERVLVDAVRGDHTLFATSEEVLDAWRIVQPVLDAWKETDAGLRLYPAGTAGQSLLVEESSYAD